MGKTVVIILLSSIFGFLNAQETGAFQKNITFTESDYNYTRTLYYYVPTDYDASNSYKLVVGFRGGPHTNAGHFRNQLQFLSDSIGAIILCPENKDHFWNDEGLTKQLFKYSLDTTMSMYNIDSEYIYLTGLSYGGRHAVIVAMDTDNGDIPQIRGVIPFAAGSDSHLAPDYESIEEFAPACICIGLNDNANFKSVSNTIHNDIQTNGGESFLNEISGVGHTVDFSTYPFEMMECINYIEAQYDANGAVNLESNEELISVFPNPSSTNIQFSIPLIIQPKAIYVTNIIGELLLVVGTEQREINVSSLPGGYVLLAIETNEKKIVKRILISK